MGQVGDEAAPQSPPHGDEVRQVELDVAARAADLGIWDWDLLTQTFVYSPRAKAIFGFAPDYEVTLEDLRRVTHPDDLPHTSAMAQRALDPALREIPHYEYRVIRPDGVVRRVVADGEAMFAVVDGVERAVRYIGVVRDITDQWAAEEALRDSQTRFQAVADSTPAPVWMTRASGEMAFVNLAFAERTGMSRDQLGGDVWLRLIHPEDLAVVAKARAAARAENLPYSFEARFRGARGVWRRMQATSNPRFDSAGTFKGYVGLAVDVTESHQALARQQLLINELNHRVKNTLASVQSIVTHSLRDGVAIEDARRVLIDRLMALSSAQNVLTQNSFESADLMTLVQDAVSPFEASASRFDTEGPTVEVGPNVATALAMALHELGTNAVKYGALSAASGRVAISWTLSEAGEAELVWRERGGPPVVTPERQGFGSRLLKSGLAADLGGGAALDFDPLGVTATLKLRTLDDGAAS